MILKALVMTHPPDYANATIASRVAAALGMDVSWCIDSKSSRDGIPSFVKVIETSVERNGNLNGEKWILEQIRIMGDECIGYDWVVKLDSDSIIGRLDWLLLAEGHHWLVGLFWPYDNSVSGPRGKLNGPCYAINGRGVSYLLNLKSLKGCGERVGEDYLIGTLIPEEHILKHRFHERKGMMSGWRWDTSREASYWLERYEVLTIHRPHNSEKSIDRLRVEIHQIMLWLERAIKYDDGSPPPSAPPNTDSSAQLMGGEC